MSYSTFYQNLSDAEYEEFMRVCLLTAFFVVYRDHVTLAPCDHVITRSQLDSLFVAITANGFMSQFWKEKK